MSIVHYYIKDGRKVFNCGQAVKDGWGVEWSDVVGLELTRRIDNHKTTITHLGEVAGIITVHFAHGGYLALDHAVEEYRTN